MKKSYLILFLVHCATRIIFIISVGFHNYLGLQPDAAWLVQFGHKAATGDLNFELDRFIASPLFPALCGVFIKIFPNNWDTYLILFQLLLSSLSGVYIYKITQCLFNNKNISLTASLIFAVFPLTMWYTNTFSQECLFQSLFIFSIYYLIRSLETGKIKYVLFSSVLFSLTYLTKSHILLFSLFIPVLYFIYFKFSRKFLVYSCLYGFICILFSMPYGLYQLQKNNTYVISSNGSGHQFYLGNTEAGYRTIVDVPAKTSTDFVKIQDIPVTAGYFNGNQPHYDSLLKLPQNVKQKFFFDEALVWIKNNPAKFVKIKIYDIYLFLMPGVNRKYYNFLPFLFSFLISFPVYILAYYNLISNFKSRNNFVVLFIFFSMFLFSTIMFTQNRFRTITIEPFYIIYFAVTMSPLLEKIPIFKRVFEIWGADLENNMLPNVNRIG